MGQQEKQTVRIIDLAPSSWFKQKEGSSIWICGHRSMLIGEADLPESIQMDMGDAYAILLRGTVKYHDSSEARIELQTEQRWYLDLSKMKEKEAPEGSYLLLLLPFDVDGAKGDEGRTKRAISSTVGLLCALKGRNVAYQRIFDNVVKMDSGETTSFTAPIENPHWFGRPDLSQRNVSLVRSVIKAVAALGEPEQNRIRLALHWFQEAIFESGTDAFLKYWIALEIVGMPDTTNIRPVSETLARAYGMSYEDAARIFGVGRLFGLRSDIVHNGKTPSLHGMLHKYLAGLFVDVLLESLGLPSEKRAQSVLVTGETALRAYIRP